MKRIRPPALKRGDVIGVCAPASPAFRAADVRSGAAYLEGLGYRVELGRSVGSRDGYLAGSDRERAADLNRFFRNRRVRAIVALRGGYGSMRILPLLDYAAVRRDPKIVVGYSDITAIQMALLVRCGLVTFAGPMVAAGMARGLYGESEELFWRMLTSRKPLGIVGGGGRGMRALRRGRAAGTLLGGNLSMLNHLVGTPYLPSARGSVLLLEDVGERPYRIDRMLQHLRLAGIFRDIRGAVLGRFADCKPEEGKPSLTLPRVFRDAFAGVCAPLVAGLHHGHVAGSLTLPIGLPVALEAGGRVRLSFSGSAVT